MTITKIFRKVVGEKRQWRQIKARIRQLPENYQVAVEALLRYLMVSGSGVGGMSIFEDLVELFEQGAASGTPIREIVGEDPIAFIELFAQNYAQEQWIKGERSRLISAIDRAASD